jgi:hypothetical protein
MSGRAWSVALVVGAAAVAACGSSTAPGAAAGRKAPEPCVALTCATAGAACGELPDGCGGILACGSCPAGQACGAGGPNVCGAPPAGDVVRWATVFSRPGSEGVIDAGVDGAGNRYLLTSGTRIDGAGLVLRLDKLSRDGTPLWHREWPFRWRSGTWGFGMAVAASGEVYLAPEKGCPFDPPEQCSLPPPIDFGGGELTDSTLVKLSADGEFAWQRLLGSDSVVALSADDRASVLVLLASTSGMSGTIEKYGADGVRRWRVDRRWSVDAIPWAGALDPAGNALVVTVEPVDGANRVSLEKLGAADGATAWTTVLPGSSPWRFGVGATENGTGVVLADRSRDAAFGGSTVTSGALVLYAVEADGEPRWALGIEALHAPRLAVDRTGRALVAGWSDPCGPIVTRAVSLAGAALWRRTSPGAPAACGLIGLDVAVAYAADHEPFVAGSFTGEVKIGDRTYSPQGATDVFGAGLAP